MTLIYWWKSLTQYKNNDIVAASLEYNLKDTNTKSSKHIFWKKEMKYWSQFSTNYWVDVTNYYKPKIYENLINKMPTNIENFILNIKYFYNGKIYTFISRNNNKYTWPPPRSNSIKFTLPIQSAFILDENGKVIKDVTNKIKKCIGPQNNFYNQKIKACDVTTIEFDTLVIKDIIQNEKKYKYDEFLEQ